jgi:membrane peptidoglycan carboxypeptidase
MQEDVANDTTFALKGVAQYSKRALEGGREVASKTGTQGLDRENNSDAWMVGYTPSLSTAVWMGTDGRKPIINANGGIIYGSGLPGAIWQRFMNAVLAGTPKEELPDEPRIDGDTGESVAQPTTQAPPPPPPVVPAPAPPTETPVIVDQNNNGVPDDREIVDENNNGVPDDQENGGADPSDPTQQPGVGELPEQGQSPGNGAGTNGG